MDSREWQANRTDTPASRRTFLAAAMATSTGLLAGCSDITTQSFEAEPVGLSEQSRADFELTEVVSDSQTITREIESIDGEVSITNQVAVYDRTPSDDPSLLERFVARTGTPGSGSATLDRQKPRQMGLGIDPAGALPDGAGNASLPDRHGPLRTGRFAGAGDLGVDELSLPFFDGEPNIGGDRVRLVVPAGARIGGSVDAVETIGLLNPPFDEVTVQTRGVSVPARTALPSSNWLPSDRSSADSSGLALDWWWPKRYLPDGVGPETPVLIPIGDSDPEDLFGLAADELPGEPIEGKTFRATGNNPFLVAAPGSHLFGDRSFDTADAFNSGGPIPLGGATYGMGVLATPNAELAGQSVNPLTALAFEDLLRSDVAAQMLASAGATNAARVEWRVGPTEVTDVPDGTEFADVPDGTEFADLSILDESAETKTFAGIITAGDYPWLAVVTLARAVPDDVVIAAGIQQTPVSSTDQHRHFRATGNNPFLRARATGNNPFVPWVGGGLALNTATFGSLEQS